MNRMEQKILLDESDEDRHNERTGFRARQGVLVNGKPRIAIVGAGIGGLTAAIFLRRLGFESTLYEQAPKLERLGAGIQL
jgi:NADPH-dependent 2,4-dienoyl-CoA reductase/sulfur reductase-like enzyme